MYGIEKSRTTPYHLKAIVYVKDTTDHAQSFENIGVKTKEKLSKTFASTDFQL